MDKLNEADLVWINDGEFLIAGDGKVLFELKPSLKLNAWLRWHKPHSCAQHVTLPSESKKSDLCDLWDGPNQSGRSCQNC